MVYSAIACVDSKFGIAKEGKIPWYISEDLKHFKRHTINKTCIVGRKTMETMPVLKDRKMIIMSRNVVFQENEIDEEKENMVIGGEEIYKEFSQVYDKIYLTILEKDYKCDKFFPKIPFYFKMTECSERYYDSEEDVYYRFLEYTKQYGDVGFQLHYPDEMMCNFTEHQYINICNELLEDGVKKGDRTGTGTLSVFGKRLNLDISDGIVPLLTTKRMAWKSCINELLWFLRGSTNVLELQKTGCKIWNGNSSKEYKEKMGLGHLLPEDCGRIYGFNWRHFGAEYTNCYRDYSYKGFDQLEFIINEIKTNPDSRRLILNGWDPRSMKEGILPPCHLMAQFYVNNGELSCQMYQRSADFFLGVPFNIFSYTVLTYIIAAKCDLKPKNLIMVFGDTHLYSDHLEQVEEQVNRDVYSKPKLILDKSIKDKKWNDMTIDDFNLVGYISNPSIKANMSV